MNKRLRFEIFKRDNFTCVYCGRQTPNVILEVDHIIPVAEGGTDDPNNLVTSCRDCNRGKGKVKLNKSLLKDNRAEEAEEILELQEQIKEYEKALKLRRRAEKRALNKINKAWAEASDNKYILNDSGLNSVKKFLQHLTATEVIDAIYIAAKKIPKEHIEDRFKYFCGICHNMIAEKRGDKTRYLYNKIKMIWLSQERGSGYYIDWQLREICEMYDEEDIIRCIDKCFSEPQGNYWEAFKEIIGYES